MEMTVTQNAILFFVLPLWVATGFADYLCHRKADIEHTAGPKESVIHLLGFGVVGVPVLAGLFLEINAGVILIMIAGFILHEIITYWDVVYANATRVVTPLEQHIHNYLALVPLIALLLAIILHWSQFAALFGVGPEKASFALALKQNALPVWYIASALTIIALFDLFPFIEELWRGIRAKRSGNSSA
jgi:hypothetical protein